MRALPRTRFVPFRFLPFSFVISLYFIVSYHNEERNCREYSNFQTRSNPLPFPRFASINASRPEVFFPFFFKRRPLFLYLWREPGTNSRFGGGYGIRGVEWKESLGVPRREYGIGKLVGIAILWRKLRGALARDPYTPPVYKSRPILGCRRSIAWLGFRN